MTHSVKGYRFLPDRLDAGGHLARSICYVRVSSFENRRYRASGFNLLGWEHINLTGDYIWPKNKRVDQGSFWPLPPLNGP